MLLNSLGWQPNIGENTVDIRNENAIFVRSIRHRELEGNKYRKYQIEEKPLLPMPRNDTLIRPHISLLQSLITFKRYATTSALARRNLRKIKRDWPIRWRLGCTAVHCLLFLKDLISESFKRNSILVSNVFLLAAPPVILKCSF